MAKLLIKNLSDIAKAFTTLSQEWKEIRQSYGLKAIPHLLILLWLASIITIQNALALRPIPGIQIKVRLTQIV